LTKYQSEWREPGFADFFGAKGIVMCTLAKTICLAVSLIFALAGAAPLYAQVKILTDYERLTIAHGLSHNRANCILQDSRGFLWIGTADGLCRYDGYTFTVFKHNPLDSTSVSDNWVYEIYEDRSKRLWIATYNGLSQFDPSTETFIRYRHDPKDPHSLSNSNVTAIYEDRSGTLWIGVTGLNQVGVLNKLVLSSTGSGKGAARETAKFIRYKLKLYSPRHPLHSRVYFILGDDTGALWIGGPGGLNKFDPQTAQVTPYLHEPFDPISTGGNRILQGVKDRSGNFWLGVYGVGLARFDPRTGNMKLYQHDPQNPQSLYSNLIQALYEDASGDIWVGTAVLSRLDRQSEKFSHFAVSPNAGNAYTYDSADAIYRIYEDQSGVQWLGTNNHGLIKVDHKPKKFVHYRYEFGNPNNLSGNEINGLYEDQTGKIWVIINDGGLNRFDPRQEKFAWFKHDPQNPFSLGNDFVLSFGESHSGRPGTLWFGARFGASRFDPLTEKFANLRDSWPNIKPLIPGIVTAVHEDRSGATWFGTNGGGLFMMTMSRGDRGSVHKWNHYKPGRNDSTSISGDIIGFIHEDRFGNLWVGAGGDLNLLDRQTGKFSSIRRDFKVEDFNARSIYENHTGKIWVPSSLGLCRIDGKTEKAARFKIVPLPIDKQAFHSESYIYVPPAAKDEVLWVGTKMGLLKVDAVAEKLLAQYTVAEGLPSNLVCEIVGDDLGNLWLLTSKGLSVFNEQAPPGKQFRNLDGKDGVINSPSAVTGLLKAKDGTIYWGGANGLYRFFPEKMKNNPHVPPVVLTEFRVFNEAVKPALPLARQMALAGRAKALGRPGLDSAISAQKQIKLAHNQNSFSFSFAALDFTRPLSNQYVYRLEGIDQDWIETGNRRYANYTHVPPGEYVFRVKGANNDGVWNETGATVKIIITPPFWQTWWFRLLALGVFVGLLEALHKYRVAKKLEIETTRNRIARDLHDDIGSSLSNIALMSELMQGKRTLEEKEIKQLRQIGATSRQIVEAMEDIVWAINPDYDKLDNLLLRLKDVTAELLRQQGITYTFHFPEQELLQSLPMNFRRNLLLIYKELLHNIIKHAQATHVEIALAKTDGCLVLKLADDGVGFDVKAVKNGTGLKSMQIRAAELKGKLEIESQPNQGTRVTLAVKL
jgi:ligand-binding sensor domain-containing protein/signal transduction histidine kinase